MNYLNERYTKVYTHKGYDICTLKIAIPTEGDSLGYSIDSPQFLGEEFNLIADAIGAIDTF